MKWTQCTYENENASVLEVEVCGLCCELRWCPVLAVGRRGARHARTRRGEAVLQNSSLHHINSEDWISFFPSLFLSFFLSFFHSHSSIQFFNFSLSHSFNHHSINLFQDSMFNILSKCLQLWHCYSH